MKANACSKRSKFDDLELGWRLIDWFSLDRHKFWCEDGLEAHTRITWEGNNNTAICALWTCPQTGQPIWLGREGGDCSELVAATLMLRHSYFCFCSLMWMQQVFCPILPTILDVTPMRRQLPKSLNQWDFPYAISCKRVFFESRGFINLA